MELRVVWLVPSMELKDLHPVQLAEYAAYNQIQENLVFLWRVPNFMQKRNRIILNVNPRYWRITHKFCIELPKEVQGTTMDDKKGDTLW